jgi:hypothetical protein
MFKFSLLASILFASFSWALTDGAMKLVHFETQANAAGKRSAVAVRLPHVEIPLAMVGLDFASRLDPRIAESLVFERNGEKFVRWILNPEDTRWGETLVKHFSENMGINLVRQYYFLGYQTASRSYIAEDPNSGA